MRKRKLFWQIYSSYLLLAFVSLMILNGYAFNKVQDFFWDETAMDLKLRAHILEKHAVSMLLNEDQSHIDDICKAIGKASLMRVSVILPSGKVLGDSEASPETMENHRGRPEIINALREKTDISIRYSRTLGKRFMYVAIPLKNQEKIIALLRTSINVSAIDEKLNSVRNKIISAWIIIALIAGGISWLISRRISEPVEKMKEGAEHFANGNLKYRVHVSGSGEIGGLAQAMNRMADELHKRISTVMQQWNETQAVLSSMLEGVVAIDKDEYIISINPAAVRMFNLEPMKWSTRSIQEVIRNPELHRFVRKALYRESPVEADINFYHKQSDYVLHTHSGPLLNAKSERIGTLVVLNDVTRLRHLENIRQDFVSNVSHELKTPLTAVKGFVETLRHGALNNPEEAERFLIIIEKHVDRLNAIIDDLLMLSKIEEGKGNKGIKLEISPLKDIILTAIQVCQTKAEKKEIKIEFECDDEINAKVNAPLLEQAVVNLLDNAIKYSDMKSMVRVMLNHANSENVIRFQDHGIGIAREHLPRLFERFYRVDKARSRKMGGTGLGLAIVKHITQSHGGHITVESIPGQGSIFTIHLPA